MVRLRSDSHRSCPARDLIHQNNAIVNFSCETGSCAKRAITARVGFFPRVKVNPNYFSDRESVYFPMETRPPG